MTSKLKKMLISEKTDTPKRNSLRSFKTKNGQEFLLAKVLDSMSGNPKEKLVYMTRDLKSIVWALPSDHEKTKSLRIGRMDKDYVELVEFIEFL